MPRIMSAKYIEIFNILRALFNITLSIVFMFILIPIIIVSFVYYFLKFTIEYEDKSSIRG